MSKPFKHDAKWVEAKQRCRLNHDDIAKAKALGLSPKTLMKNIPGPQQKWKLPMKFWIRELYRGGGEAEPVDVIGLRRPAGPGARSVQGLFPGLFVSCGKPLRRRATETFLYQFRWCHSC